MDQQGEVNVWEYNHLGMVTEFRYCSKVMEAAASLWSIPGVYDPGWNMLSSEDAFVFVDNHDNQVNMDHLLGDNPLYVTMTTLKSFFAIG